MRNLGNFTCSSVPTRATKAHCSKLQARTVKQPRLSASSHFRHVRVQRQQNRTFSKGYGSTQTCLKRSDWSSRRATPRCRSQSNSLARWVLGVDRGCQAARGPTMPRPLLLLRPPRLHTRASCTLRSLDRGPPPRTTAPRETAPPGPVTTPSTRRRPPHWEVPSSRPRVPSFGHTLWLTLPLPPRPPLPSYPVPQRCNTRPRSCTRHFTLRSQCDLTYDAPPKPPPPQPRRCHPSTCASRSQRTSQLCRFLIRRRRSAPCITRCLTSCPRPHLPRQSAPRVRSPARSNNPGRQHHSNPAVGLTTLPARRCLWPTSDSSCPSMSSKRSSAASPGSVVCACTPRVARPWRLSSSGMCAVPRRPWQRSRVASCSPRTAGPCVLSTRRARWPRARTKSSGQCEQHQRSVGHLLVSPPIDHRPTAALWTPGGLGSTSTTPVEGQHSTTAAPSRFHLEPSVAKSTRGTNIIPSLYCSVTNFTGGSA